MKFGEQLERASVPEWSLHNVDYNSLKHEIKVHTTRDQATAIAIPGHTDASLKKFEDGFYAELFRQHDRVGLFVMSKADEISRRLEHLAACIQRLVARCGEPAPLETLIRRQRKFARYERNLGRCGDDIEAMERFIGAQVLAFRKILKKYKKWTGSVTLDGRFRENVLSDPKSFARRDLVPLLERRDELLAAIRAATADFTEPSSPETDDGSNTPREVRINTQPEFYELPPPQTPYWNEYDYPSDGAAAEESYTIYVEPGEPFGFPGLASVRAAFTAPFEKAKLWLSPSLKAERRPLLTGGESGYSATGLVPDTEDDYTSSDDYPSVGYTTHYASLPSVNEQSITRYRERVLFGGAVGCFLASYVLTVVAVMLLTTGRHKQKLQVDAGVMFGVVASLLAACLGLGMTLYRRDTLGVWHRLTVWMVFMSSCVLNGMLLVLVLLEW